MFRLASTGPCSVVQLYLESSQQAVSLLRRLRDAEGRADALSTWRNKSLMRYVGHLSRKDPLYGYLRYDILSRIGVHNTPDFRVFKLNASKKVYLYEDKRSHARVVGKFYGSDSHRSHESARHAVKREYNNLKTARGIGFRGYPHYVARPLGYNTHLNCVLVAEYCFGTQLHEFIVRAIWLGGRDALFQKLTALAYFLATFHNHTANGLGVDFNEDSSYFDHIVNQLTKRGYIGWTESQELYWLRDRWREKRCVWEDQQVLVHGDVTPANISFGDGLWVIAIDLERMKRADRVFDVGRICGEIKHFFMQYSGNKDLAEPFIGHFLWEYACHFPDRQRAFASITRRVPFYMGLTLLRIARNSWVDGHYRRNLVEEAKKTLR
jgi:aminoglycoside phosphotransferase (APT) family kinase protein